MRLNLNHRETKVSSKWDQPRPSETKWDQVRPSENKWIQVRPSETKWDQVRPSEIMWDHVRPSETNWDQVRPSEIPPPPTKPPIQPCWPYGYIGPIYLWGINSGKAPNGKVFFQKKASKYQHIEVKCYVLSRVRWKHERNGIKIRAFCLKHFAQSCHMRSIVFKKSGSKKIGIFNETSFPQKSPRSVWEWSGGIPDLSGPIFKQFPLTSIKI